ncbi:MAG: hypothetical protein K0U64_05515 [Actinomycetia bacterium]|nr:hypothetical protein [Actinomycetes bacterium]
MISDKDVASGSESDDRDRANRHLEAFLDDFELLKLQVRLSADLKSLPVRQQAHLAELTDEKEQRNSPAALAIG